MIKKEILGYLYGISVFVNVISAETTRADFSGVKTAFMAG